jgi:hypothetical protein
MSGSGLALSVCAVICVAGLRYGTEWIRLVSAAGMVCLTLLVLIWVVAVIKGEP